MPNNLSILGILHTLISIIAVIMGFYGLFEKGRINPDHNAGRLYTIFTVIACLSSLPIMKNGHPSPGHALAIVILILLPLGVYARSIRLFRRSAIYIQTIFLSTTLFLSLIPAVIETLTRIPPDDPVATGPNSFVVQVILLALTILYLLGVSYQLLRIRARRRMFKVPPKIV